MALVFQSGALLNSLTVGENVGLYLTEHRLKKPVEIERIVTEKLDFLGLKGVKDRSPGELSGGMKKRVAIARALVIEPAILLADEPTGNLDSANSKRITQALRELVDQHGQTIIMVTHDPAVAEQADRVVYLLDGQVEREETNRVTPVRPRRVEEPVPTK